MQAMEAGFEKANPKIGLQSVTLAWGNPYYTKLSLATIGHKPPSVAVAHLTRMKTLQAADLLQELQPADLARHGMTADKFNQKAWQAGLVNGKIYAIPLDTHPFVCFYNTAVCKKAGLLDSSGQVEAARWRGGIARCAGEGQEGHRPVRRNHRRGQRDRDPVAHLPVAVRPTRRIGAGRSGHQGRHRRPEGAEGAELPQHAEQAEVDVGPARLSGCDRLVQRRPGRVLLPGRVGDQYLPDGEDAVQHDPVPQRLRRRATVTPSRRTRTPWWCRSSHPSPPANSTAR